MKNRSSWQSSAVLAFTSLVLAWSNSALAQDPSVDRLLASHCAQCHGTNGYAVGEFESIAGEEAKDLYEDLADCGVSL